MDYNWLQIDAHIVNMMSAYTDKDKLYSDLRKKFNWNDSQVAAATDPLLKRYKWYDRVANGQITEKATKKVKKVVEKMNYVPSDAARLIGSVKTPRTIKILTPNITDENYAEIITTIMNIAPVYRYSVEVILYENAYQSLEKTLDDIESQKIFKTIVYLGKKRKFEVDIENIVCSYDIKSSDNVDLGTRLFGTARQKIEGR